MRAGGEPSLARQVADQLMAHDALNVLGNTIEISSPIARPRALLNFHLKSQQCRIVQNGRTAPFSSESSPRSAYSNKANASCLYRQCHRRKPRSGTMCLHELLSQRALRLEILADLSTELDGAEMPASAADGAAGSPRAAGR